jgi:hypothetical protein
MNYISRREGTFPMPDEDREATLFNLIEKLMKGPVARAELEKKGFEDWSPSETAQLLASMLSAEMLVEKDGKLEPAEKGRFFWKRVRRKRQGFV